MDEGESGEVESVEMTDGETGDGIDWSLIFFRLHHYCHLDKFKILQYTLPQVTELLRQTGKHIEFEVQVRTNPFGGFGGGGSSSTEEISTAGTGEYEEMTEDDLHKLSQALGGG